MSAPLVTRVTTEADVPAVLALLRAEWPREAWCEEKFAHYYSDYPDGEPVSLASFDPATGRACAHVGLLPVMVSGISGYLVLQIVVAESHRRGPALIELVREAERLARGRGARFLCGFGNPRFARVAERFFGWPILGYLVFTDVEVFDASAFRDRFHFEYGPHWQRWKYGEARAVQVIPYVREGRVHHQLQKTSGWPAVRAAEHGADRLNLWHPDQASPTEPSGWSQPFLFHPLDPTLPASMRDLRRWYIEMGDSDTFEPHRPWVKP